MNYQDYAKYDTSPPYHNKQNKAYYDNGQGVPPINENNMTIQDITEKLEKTFQCKIEIDNCLLQKPIFVAGEQYANPQTILQSLARLFNLRYVKNNDIYYLKRKIILPV